MWLPILIAFLVMVAIASIYVYRQSQIDKSNQLEYDWQLKWRIVHKAGNVFSVEQYKYVKDDDFIFGAWQWVSWNITYSFKSLDEAKLAYQNEEKRDMTLRKERENEKVVFESN